MKERYQDIEDKNESLRGYFAAYKEKAQDFLARFEMSWIYHDNALEGVVYSATELSSALHPGVMAAEATLMPVLLEIRNHKAAVDYIREQAVAQGKKQMAISMEQVKRVHDLLLGNTAEAMAARALTERREKSERELSKERERSGYRKDMPLHRTYFHDIAQPAKIQPALEKLLDYTTTSEFKEFHPIKQAATFQHSFIQIFPFAEHSGKVGRMISNLILLRAGFMPCIIHSIDRQRYYDAFRGTSAVFRSLLMDAMENSLDNGLKYFRDLGRQYKAIN